MENKIDLQQELPHQKPQELVERHQLTWWKLLGKRTSWIIWRIDCVRGPWRRRVWRLWMDIILRCVFLSSQRIVVIARTSSG